MSDQLPDKEIDQQFDDLPLPDEETSWQKMKELLDKNDDDRIIPPVLLRSCLGWGIFLLVGLGITWFIVRYEQWGDETVKTKQTSSSAQREKTSTDPEIKKDEETVSTKSLEKQDPGRGPRVIEKYETKIKEKDIDVVPNSNSRSLTTRLSSAREREKKALRSELIRKQQKDQSQNKKSLTVNKEQKNIIQSTDKEILPTNESNPPNDTIAAVAKQPIVKDTTKTADPILTQDSAAKKIVQNKKKFLLSAGIGEQQQIPVAGQTAVPYSSYGRKGSLSDYVPSIYIQLQKEKKWFIQAEFRYGAAQSVKELSYNRKTNYDSSSRNVSVTTMRLKKTYYHQLPLSFNYYLKSNFSVSIGGIYSRFYRAITEREIQTMNVQTRATSSVKEIIPVRQFTDSFLYKTQVHVLMQADYQWKKFSFGLRYTKDVQPYIRYTRPDGTVDEEKNQSLQLIVRYRILRFKNF